MITCDLDAIQERREKARRLLSRKESRAVTGATFAVTLIAATKDIRDLIDELIEQVKETVVLRARMTELECEIEVDNKLLAERNRVLDAIPECPSHGSECIPHAMEWIAETCDENERLRVALKQLRVTLRGIRLLAADDLRMGTRDNTEQIEADARAALEGKE